MKFDIRLIASVILAGMVFIGTGCKTNSYDVVIYGGSPAGVATAIQVAKMGKTAAIVVPWQKIGGLLVNGGGNTDIDGQKDFQNSAAVGGLALEFYDRIARAYGREEKFREVTRNGIKDHSLWIFEPHVAQKVIDDWLAEYNDKIKIFVGRRLREEENAVTKRDGKIEQIVLDNGETVSGEIFIDASLMGDLLKDAGISYFVGRESNTQYNEELNGIIGNTTHSQFSVKIDPYKIPGDPESGLIYTIQPDSLGTPGAEDRIHLQAYCFRPCLTINEGNKMPFRKPSGYDRSQYEIYIRYLKAGGKLYKPWVNLPNEKCELNAWNDLSHNLYGMNQGYPEGDYNTRKRIEEKHWQFTEGLFYFLANDDEVGAIDQELQDSWRKWGLAKDEFVYNNYQPEQFYMRDGRRMISDYVITEHQVLKPEEFPVADPVSMAYWPMDLHSVRRIVIDGVAYNEGAVFRPGGPWKPFQISYRSLIPREGECTNLLTPTCVSSSHIAYGAVRIEWTYMALGQAAGTAAVLAIKNGTAVQKVNYKELEKHLREDGQILEIPLKDRE